MVAANAVMQAAQNLATAASAGKGLSYDLGDFSLKGIPNNRERMEYLKDEVAATTQDFYDRGELAAMNVFGKNVAASSSRIKTKCRMGNVKQEV